MKEYYISIRKDRIAGSQRHSDLEKEVIVKESGYIE
jgi:hypothetical protein